MWQKYIPTAKCKYWSTGTIISNMVHAAAAANLEQKNKTQAGSALHSPPHTWGDVKLQSSYFPKQYLPHNTHSSDPLGQQICQ